MLVGGPPGLHNPCIGGHALGSFQNPHHDAEMPLGQP